MAEEAAFVVAALGGAGALAAVVAAACLFSHRLREAESTASGHHKVDLNGSQLSSVAPVLPAVAQVPVPDLEAQPTQPEEPQPPPRRPWMPSTGHSTIQPPPPLAPPPERQRGARADAITLAVDADFDDEAAVLRGEFMAAASMLSQEELREFVSDHISNELREIRAMPGEQRSQAFRMLCAEWHPDKCPAIEGLATEVFQRLQAQKTAFLAKK